MRRQECQADIDEYHGEESCAGCPHLQRREREAFSTPIKSAPFLKIRKTGGEKKLPIKYLARDAFLSLVNDALYTLPVAMNG